MASRTNPLALAVLVCLLEAPMHPYQIAQTLRSRAKEESVKLNYGSLYGVVESLEKRGLIRARETLRSGRRPERTIYEITEAVARDATDWLDDLLSVPAKEFPAFLSALSFLPALPPDDAVAALRRRIGALEIRLLRWSSLSRGAAQAGLPRLFEIEGDYEAHMLSAELDFVRKLLEEIEGGTLDGLQLWRAIHTDDPEEAKALADFRFPPEGEK